MCATWSATTAAHTGRHWRCVLTRCWQEQAGHANCLYSTLEVHTRATHSTPLMWWGSILFEATTTHPEPRNHSSISQQCRQGLSRHLDSLWARGKLQQQSCTSTATYGTLGDHDSRTRQHCSDYSQREPWWRCMQPMLEHSDIPNSTHRYGERESGVLRTPGNLAAEQHPYASSQNQTVYRAP